nr:MAG TPA: hypothetical protein [Ackermannviridae sp.]
MSTRITPAYARNKNTPYIYKDHPRLRGKHVYIVHFVFQ